MACTVTKSLLSAIFVVFTCLLLVFLIEVHAVDVADVTTTTGTISGLFDSTSGSNLFLGIPYAEPAVGDLRFAAPVPKTAWEGNRRAHAHGASCPQDIQSDPMFQDLQDEAKIVSEDCLTLNVYSPNAAVSEAVMVWLHGGLFERGQAAAYNGADLASKGVVVVTLNYRLGPLGFLSTGDDTSTGDYGLLDQRLAMQWVKDNIAEFGGDPNKVTLFGHDVGASSILQHLLFPESRDLFSRAILQSISSSYPAEPVNNVAHAKALAAALGCTDDELVVDCLRAASLYEIMNGQKQVKRGHGEKLVWGPVTTFRPTTLQDMGSRHDLIVGFSSSAGSWALDNLGQGPISQEEWEAYSERFLSTGLGGDGDDCHLLQSALNHEYLITPFSSASDGMLRLQRAVDLNTDYNYVMPTAVLLQEARILADNVFTYVFDQQTDSDKRYSSWLQGSPHNSILQYVWSENTGFNLTTGEEDLKDVIMTYWTDFAKFGSPNGLNTTVAWPEYDETNQRYLRLQAQNIRAQQAYRASKVNFWQNWLPELTENSACEEDEQLEKCNMSVGGDFNLTPHDAELVLIILLIALAVVGLLCIVLFAVSCGYRDRSNTLYRRLQDTEVGHKSRAKASTSLPSTVIVSDPFLEDGFPPPPPLDTEDNKPLIPDSPVPSEAQEDLPVVNQAFSDDDDEDVRQALDDMDSAVADADTASIDLVDGSQTDESNDVPEQETTEEPKVDEEQQEAPTNDGTPAEEETSPEKEAALEEETAPEKEATVDEETPKEVEAAEAEQGIK